MLTSRQLLIAVSACALLVTGCGGGGGGNGATKAQYLARADRICAGVNKQLRDLGTPQNPAQFQSFAEEAVPLLHDGLRRLRALKAPSEIAGRVGELYRELAKGADLIRRAGLAGKAGDAAQLQQIATEAAGIAADTGREANAIGLKSCGRAPGI
jgi:hypothetical protein